MDSSDEITIQTKKRVRTRRRTRRRRRRVGRYGTIRFPSDGTRGEERAEDFESIWLTLEQKPQDEEYCWLDTKAVREKKAKEAEMRKENKRGREAERLSREELVYRKIQTENFRRRGSGEKVQAHRRENPKRHHLRQIQALALANNVPGKTTKQRTHVLIRWRWWHSRVFSPKRHRPEEERQVTLEQRFRRHKRRAKERPGLHSLPLSCVELILKHYAKIEGTEELTAIRNKLI